MLTKPCYLCVNRPFYVCLSEQFLSIFGIITRLYTISCLAKMKTKIHQINNTTVVEVLSEQYLINNTQDGIDLLGNLYYQGFDKVIIHQKNIVPSFFELKNRIAGEILQKFSTYRVKLVIAGNFSIYNSSSLDDFIYESNKGNQVNFVASVAEAIEKHSK